MKFRNSRSRPFVTLLAVVAVACTFAAPVRGPVLAANYVHETMPPSLASVTFTDVSVLATPDPAFFAPSYRYRAVVVGSSGSAARVGGWNSATQTWRDFGSLGSGATTPHVVQWWDGTCPATLIIDGNGHSYYWSLTTDSGGDCQDPVGNPTYITVSGNTPVIAIAASSHGGVVGGTSDTSVTYSGGMVLGVKYTGGTSTLQRFTDDGGNPVWSNYPASGACSTAGRINALAIGYSATTDRIRVIGVGDAGKVLRYDEGTNTCTSSTIGTQKLTAVTAGNALDLTQLGVFAVGSAGSLWSSTDGGSSWSQEVPGNPYSKWGFLTIPGGVDPDFTGIATFPSGLTGRFGVIVGKNATSGQTFVGPLYHVADLTQPVVESPSSNVYADLMAVAGVDPTHYWAVGAGGTVLRSTMGAVAGNAWFAPIGSGNGFFTKLSCSVTTPGVSCNDLGSNYGLSFEPPPPSGFKSGALTGQAWVGLADSLGAYSLLDVRPPLQSTTEAFGPNGSGYPMVDAVNEQNRPSEVAVAANSLFVGARIGTPTTGGGIASQPIERIDINADGTLTLPAPGNCSSGPGAQDYLDDEGFYRLASTVSGGKNWIHMVSPAALTSPLRVRTADITGDWCTDLQLETIHNFIPTPNGCTYDRTRGDFESIGDGANFYVIGGHCSNGGGSDTNTILRVPINASGSAGAAVLNPATLPAGFGRINLKASIADSGSAKALVLFDPIGNQIAVGRINRSNNEVCTGVTGTVCTLTTQTVNALPSATPSAFPSAVGASGTTVLAVYARPTLFDTPSLRGHSVLAAPLRFDVDPAGLVGGWTAGEDRPATVFPPSRVTTWKSGTRTVAYLGPYFDDRLWAAVDRYDTELIPSSPGWLSFDLIDNFNPDTATLETPPVRAADCLAWANQSAAIGKRGISFVNTSSAPQVYDCGGGKVDTIRAGEVWGWARFLNLKRAGELRSPAETDWGWISLRGPAVTNAQDYTKFSCYSCDSNTQTCDICQSSNAKTETAPGPQPTCSQCSGCSFGATNTCTACTACRQYGVSYDRSTGNFHGYAWSGGQSSAGTDVGYGWVSFEQGITGSQSFSSFVQAQYGDIYAGGNIVSSRGATPFGEFGICNAFVIQSTGATISSLCSGLSGYEPQCANPGNANQASNCGTQQSTSNSSTFNPGVVTNSTVQPFPQLRNNYTTSLGKLDVTGLKTITKTVGLTKYNKYGIEVKEMTDAEFLSAFAAPAGGVLGGKVYVIRPTGPSYTLLVTQQLKFNNAGSGVSGAGLIIIEGTLYLQQNIIYDAATVSRLSQIASAGWITVTNSSSGVNAADLYVASPVNIVSGTFYISGVVNSLSNGTSDSQLLFHGPVMAHRFSLTRNAIGGAGSSAQGAEVFIDDSRLRLNPPPGLDDIAAKLPVYQ